MRTPRRSRRAVSVLVVVALVLALSTVLLGRAGARADRCQVLAERSAARAALVTVRGRGAERTRRVLVVGDSWSVGASLPPRQSWPTRLPGRVRVAGFGGSGFTRHASPCGDRSYATRLRLALRAEARAGRRVDVLVLEGGLNDTDQPAADLDAGFARVVRVLDERRPRVRRVLVVGPAPAPLRSLAQVRRVDAALARLSATAGYAYVSSRDLHLTYTDDRLHPDAAGQRRFGDRVAARLGDLR